MSYSDNSSPAPCDWLHFLENIPIHECPTFVSQGTILETHRGNSARFCDPFTRYKARDVIHQDLIVGFRTAFRKSQRPEIIPAVNLTEHLENEAATCLTRPSEMYSTTVWPGCATAFNTLIIGRLNAVANANGNVAKVAGTMAKANYRIHRREEKATGKSKVDIIVTLEPFFDDTTNAPQASPRWLSSEEFGKRITTLSNEVYQNGDLDESRFSPQHRSEFPRMVLAIIELKKPGTISPTAWQVASLRRGRSVKRGQNDLRNVRIMDGQVAEYSVAARCKYCILTEYNKQMLLKVENSALSATDGGDICRTWKTREALLFFTICNTSGKPTDDSAMLATFFYGELSGLSVAILNGYHGYWRQSAEQKAVWGSNCANYHRKRKQHGPGYTHAPATWGLGDSGAADSEASNVEDEDCNANEQTLRHPGYLILVDAALTRVSL
ncbi:hypothetical protein BDZ89DRAFT_1041257 [Hymenopellis radicata]|nr:hypothetical protein BDZ89DRAFT_1041257 [Hymenopellis radicata]